MKILKVTLATAAVAAFTVSAAQAQDSGAYINVGVQTFEFETYNVVGRVGYDISKNFGIEGEGSFGVIGTEENGVDIDTPYSLGGYILGRLPVGEQFDLFARVGYTVVNIEGEGFGQQESLTLDGVAGGIGVQYNFDESNGLRLGYTAADLDGNGGDIIDLVYVRKF